MRGAESCQRHEVKLRPSSRASTTLLVVSGSWGRSQQEHLGVGEVYPRLAPASAAPGMYLGLLGGACATADYHIGETASAQPVRRVERGASEGGP